MVWRVLLTGIDAKGVEADVERRFGAVLDGFRASFARKDFPSKQSEPDLLMEVFGLTNAMKLSQPQYWGRELGSCWERLVKEACAQAPYRVSFPPPGSRRTPCDIILRQLAIETKYRVGSGDSGTLQKLQANGRTLQKAGFEPILLILRNDSLPNAMAAARAGGWRILADADAFEFIRTETGVDLKAFMMREAVRCRA